MTMAEPDAEAEIPDPSSMATEEFVDWLLSEPEPVPLASFPLHTDAGRKGFLREYFNRGEPAIFEAVSHIWSTLNEPQEARCTTLGIAAGTGGKGKTALVNLLTAALDQAMSINALLPRPADFDSMDQWHEAVIASFGEEERETNDLIQKYADILNGGSPGPNKSNG